MGGIAWLAGAAAVIAALWLPGQQADFIYDWLSLNAFVSGVDPYQPIDHLANLHGLGVEGFYRIHPRTPGALVLQAPAGLIPLEWTYHTGRLMVVLSGLFLAWVIARLANLWTAVVISAVPVALLIWPFADVLRWNQVGFLVAGLIGVSWLMGDRFTAGLPLAAAVSLKLWPWLCIPALWVTGRRRAAVGATGGVIVLNVLPLGLPHISVEGTLRMLGDAAEFGHGSIPSALGLPFWIAGLIGLVTVVALRHHAFQWSVPIALAVAPTLWAHYLPALTVSVAIWHSSHLSTPESLCPLGSPETPIRNSWYPSRQRSGVFRQLRIRLAGRMASSKSPGL